MIGWIIAAGIAALVLGKSQQGTVAPASLTKVQVGPIPDFGSVPPQTPAQTLGEKANSTNFTAAGTAKSDAAISQEIQLGIFTGVSGPTVINPVIGNATIATTGGGGAAGGGGGGTSGGGGGFIPGGGKGIK